MKHLLPTTDIQTIKIIPRVYSTSVTINLRDDSTNDVVSVILPTSEIKGNYLELSSIFTLKEGRFYDLKVYEIKGSYKEFKENVIALGGTFENNTCLLTFLEAEGLVNTTDLDIIYRDKIFCTAQSTNQSANESYSVNKDEYKPKSGNNDFIIL
tara:strand:+ start:185 stop:646 length:462 start_codon:yes stop_codon:yes gene_type:complete